MRSTNNVFFASRSRPLPEQSSAVCVQPIWMRTPSNVAMKLSLVGVLHVQHKHGGLGLIAEEGILVQIVRQSCGQVQLKAPGS